MTRAKGTKLDPDRLVAVRRRKIEKLHAERATGLGGSDVGAVLGLNPHWSPLDVYLDKIGIGHRDPPGPDVQRGIWFEPLALHLYAAETGYVVRRQIPVIRHGVHRCLLVHIDAWIDTDSDELIAEVKCPRMRTIRGWETKGVPPHYVAQMQHGLALTGAKAGLFILFNAETMKLLHFRIERDQQAIEQMVEIEARWWRDHVVARKPPEERSEPEIEIAGVAGKLVRMEDLGLIAATERYLEARELLDLAEDLKKQERDLLATLEPGRYDGPRTRVVVTQQAGRTSFDKKALSAVRPVDPIKVASHLNGKADLGLVIDALKASEIDLAQYEKRGEPFTTVQVYRTREAE